MLMSQAHARCITCIAAWPALWVSLYTTKPLALADSFHACPVRHWWVQIEPDGLCTHQQLSVSRTLMCKSSKPMLMSSAANFQPAAITPSTCCGGTAVTHRYFESHEQLGRRPACSDYTSGRMVNGIALGLDLDQKLLCDDSMLTVPQAPLQLPAAMAFLDKARPDVCCMQMQRLYGSMARLPAGWHQLLLPLLLMHRLNELEGRLLPLAARQPAQGEPV